MRPFTSQDAILTIHPNATNAWRGVLPVDPDDPPPHTEISTPPRAWQRDSPQWQDWLQVASAIAACPASLPVPSPGQRIAVLMKGPFSLGAMVGAALEAHGREVIVFQEANQDGGSISKSWEGWPCSGPVENGYKYFEEPDLPRDRDDEDRPVVLVIEISRSIVGDVKASLKQLGLDRYQKVVGLSSRKFGQGGMARDDVAQAVAEISRCIDALGQVFPRSPVHLFYCGSLTVPLYLGQRLKVQSGLRPVSIYEYIRFEGGRSEYVEMVRFPGASLVELENPLDGVRLEDMSPEGALALLISLLGSVPDIKALAASVPDGQSLIRNLPNTDGQVSIAVYAHALVNGLQNRGLIGPAFFDQLRRRLLKLGEAVRLVEQRWTASPVQDS